MRWFSRWERYFVAFLAGVAVSLLALAAYNEAHELHRIGVLERSVRDHDANREARALREAVVSARGALAEGMPLSVSRYLATGLMEDVYHHQMDYAAALLRAGDFAGFNELRKATPFVVLSLGGRDLSGLDLTGARLADADLSGCRLRRAILRSADLSRADLGAADLTGADLTGASFQFANLSGANLTGVHGKGASFQSAVLHAATLAHISELAGARFDDAVLTQANLIGSRLPGAHFVRTNMLLASLVEADLTGVAELDRVDLTGANLGGARLDPARCSALWLTGATGLDRTIGRRLRSRGCVFTPAGVVELVAPAITTGFRAQIAEDPEVPPDRRRSTLLGMLKDYYLE